MFRFRLFLLQFCFLDQYFSSFSAYGYFSSFLFASLIFNFFFLLRRYVSCFFFKQHDSKALQLAHSTFKKLHGSSRASLFTIYTRCFRYIRKSRRFVRLGKVIRSSGYILLLFRRFFTFYSKRKRRAKLRTRFVSAALSVLPLYVTRRVINVAQPFLLNSTSQVSTARTPLKRSLVAYRDSSDISVLHVRKKLRVALNKMFKKNL